MHPLIRDIKKSLNSEFEEYKENLTYILKSDVAIIDNIAKYIVRHKGKGLRPLLVILSSKLAGKPNKNTFIVATLIEILHTATLVHDDVVDNSSIRRNFPAINAIWKNKVSVLMGDYLLAKSLISATETKSMEIMNLLAETSRRLSQGELFQIEKSRKLNITEEEYFRLISDKTAALISACTELGAITVKTSPEKQQALKEYGENLGIAFQIKDDILDYEGKQKIIGKPVGGDIKEKKITLPLIIAMKNAQTSEKKNILKMLKKGAAGKDIQTVITFCMENEGLSGAKEAMKYYAANAKEKLDIFPESNEKENAYKFVDYVIGRNK
jgi:octaprenyl-diphosphate synthase